MRALRVAFGLALALIVIAAIMLAVLLWRLTRAAHRPGEDPE